MSKKDKISIIKKTPLTVDVRIECDLESKIASIRSFLFAGLKSYATDTVTFFRNDNAKVLPDPEVAQRLGACRVYQDQLEKQYRKNGVYRCEVEILADQDYVDVRTDSLELLDENGNRTGIFPYMKGILITKLMKNQKFHVITSINKDNASAHVKYRSGLMNKMLEQPHSNPNAKKIFIVGIESYGHVSIDKIYQKIVKNSGFKET